MSFYRFGSLTHDPGNDSIFWPLQISDSVTKIEMRHKERRTEKQKTRAVRESHNPVWDDQLVFAVPPDGTGLHGAHFLLTVMHLHSRIGLFWWEPIWCLIYHVFFSKHAFSMHNGWWQWWSVGGWHEINALLQHVWYCSILSFSVWILHLFQSMVRCQTKQ